MLKELGDYQVRRLIGEGGMGKVYEGEERLSKRRVALKVLRPELARSEDGRRLFLNEMRILAHLEHPNIVRSLASLEANGELVMVLEYLDGRTLRAALVEDRRFPWPEAVRVASAMASALVAAHGQEPPIVHRDLKPENVMLLENGGVKVMDFGVAKVLAELHATNTQSVGTLQYMSPEQIDARSIDGRTDLYALGLVLYEMLEGRAPFVSASPRELLNLQCTADAPPLSDEVRAGLPKGVEALLFQLLEKAPEDRPSCAEDVIERLAPFQSAGTAPGRKTRTLPSPEPEGASAASARHVATKDVATPPKATDGERVSTPPREPSKAPANLDTVALVERVSAPRELSTKVAIALVLVLSVLAGIVTYTLSPARDAGGPSPGATARASAGPRGAGDKR
jgi:serine/threonine protein kinase